MNYRKDARIVSMIIPLTFSVLLHRRDHRNRWNSRDLQRKRSELQLSLGSNDAILERRLPHSNPHVKRARDESNSGTDDYSTFSQAQYPEDHQHAPHHTTHHSGVKKTRLANHDRNASSTPHSGDVSIAGNQIRAQDRWTSEWVGHSSTPPASMTRPYDFSGGGQYYTTPMPSPSYLLDSSSNGNGVLSHTASDPRAPTYPVTTYEEVSTPTTYSQTFYSSSENSNPQSYYTAYPTSSEAYSVGFSANGTVVGGSRDLDGASYSPSFDLSNASHSINSSARFAPASLNSRHPYLSHPPASGMDLASILRPSPHVVQLHASPDSQSILTSSVFGEISPACTDIASSRRPNSAQPTLTDHHTLDTAWSLGNCEQSGIEGDPNAPYPN